jgi:hypothetical protein
MGWLIEWTKKLLSVNPNWRTSLMHPTEYRPPCSKEAPYKPPEDQYFADRNYRYHDNRDQKSQAPPTLIIKAPDLKEDTLKEPFVIKQYKLEPEDTFYGNQNEYWNVKYFK